MSRLENSRQDVKSKRLQNRRRNGDGKTAVALTTTTAPDVILLAVGLPMVDGIQAARSIIRATPLPLVITTHQDPTTVERATKSGAMGYLIKPLRNGELTPVIDLRLDH